MGVEGSEVRKDLLFRKKCS